MKKHLFLFFCLFTINVVAQQFYVKDSYTKEELPYACIQFLDKNKGLYANKNGAFLLENANDKDSIIVSYLGYGSLKLKISAIVDTIYLKPKTEELSEIIIPVGSFKKEKIGFVNRRKNLRWHLTQKQEIATLILSKRSFNKAFIHKILIPISKGTTEAGNKNEVLNVVYPNFSSIVKVNLYSNKNNAPGDLIISKPIYISCNQDSPKELEINLKDDPVLFPSNGVFISVEVIESKINNVSSI